MTTTPFPKAVRGVAAVGLDGHRVYLAGGYGTDEEGFLAQAWIYHQDTDSYPQATALPMAICTTLVKCGDLIYALGGEDQKKHRSAQCFKISAAALLEQK
jgi:N-acetylneuraminic acid mutarotase